MCIRDSTDYSMAGRTYRYTDKNILYPFGYGLTYGTISYSGAKTEQETSAVLDDVTVCTKVKNESAYPLHESVEVYVKYKNAQSGEPGFQLKGIACVELQAGEEKEAVSGERPGFDVAAPFLEALVDFFEKERLRRVERFAHGRLDDRDVVAPKAEPILIVGEKRDGVGESEAHGKKTFGKISKILAKTKKPR